MAITWTQFRVHKYLIRGIFFIIKNFIHSSNRISFFLSLQNFIWYSWNGRTKPNFLCFRWDFINFWRLYSYFQFCQSSVDGFFPLFPEEGCIISSNFFSWKKFLSQLNHLQIWHFGHLDRRYANDPSRFLISAWLNSDNEIECDETGCQSHHGWLVTGRIDCMPRSSSCRVVIKIEIKLWYNDRILIVR